MEKCKDRSLFGRWMFLEEQICFWRSSYHLSYLGLNVIYSYHSDRFHLLSHRQDHISFQIDMKLGIYAVSQHFCRIRRLEFVELQTF